MTYKQNSNSKSLLKDFECKSVNYESRDKTCVLLESNVGLSGSLVEDYSWTYFERIETQVNYESRDITCIFLESNVGLSGSLVEDCSWTHFERIESQVN